MFYNAKTVKHTVSIALPAVGEMVLYMMLWVFDTMMVGIYGGNKAVSTVGICSEVLYITLNIFIIAGVSVSIVSLVARSIGSRKVKYAEEYATLGLAAGTLLSLALFLTIYSFSGGILRLAGADEDLIRYGIIYLRTASVGMFFYMIMCVLNGILRGYGNTKTPLLASVIVNIVNLALDWILIFGRFGFPELGIKGAAIATSFAQIMGFFFIVSYVWRKSEVKPRARYLLHFNPDRLKVLVRLSIPSGLQEGAVGGSRLVSAFMIMHLGTVSFAANQIATTLESVSFMPGWGFAIAATTLVGLKVGEDDMSKAKEYAFTCAALGTGLMTLCSLLFLFFPHSLVSLFISQSEAQVISLGAVCLMVAAVEQPFMAVAMILGGALKGSGDTRTPFLVSLVSGWGIRIPLAYYAIFHLKLPVTYIWWITAFQWIFEAAAIMLLFNRSMKKYAIANKIEQ
ncbi:MAG: multidrug transporter MatE [Firmicutes bacterium]|nr:multidrug transporter MatE [Bacillota bacterium]